MPTYEYRCREGHTFEAFQSISDDPLDACQVCGAPVERVLHPVAVHFKGSGFYSTDYAAKGKAGASADGDSSAGSSEGKADSKGEAKSSSGEDGKAAKAGSSSD